MTTIESIIASTIQLPEPEISADESQLAAAAFLARYSGRTLDAYRHDLRGFFQWAADIGLVVLDATRPQIELFRCAMEERGLAPSTIDRRLSTVCGFYRFAHIDGRITSNPAQYVRRPKVPPSEGHGMDRGELGTFLFTAERCDRDHAALAVLLGLNGLRVSEACATNIEDLGFQRGHRTLHIIGKGNKPATIPLVPRTARTIDLAIGARHEGPILRRRDGQRLIGAPPIGGSGPSVDERVWEPSTRTCSAPGSSWPRSPPAYRCVMCRSPHATPTPEQRRSTTAGERTSTDTPPTLWSRLSLAADERRSPRAAPRGCRAIGQRVMTKWIRAFAAT